jgi:hypothetical protein
MVLHLPIFALSPYIRSFSAACLAPEGCFWRVCGVFEMAISSTCYLEPSERFEGSRRICCYLRHTNLGYRTPCPERLAYTCLNLSPLESAVGNFHFNASPNRSQICRSIFPLSGRKHQSSCSRLRSALQAHPCRRRLYHRPPHPYRL